MKNLANCKPSEFLRQTNRIKKSAERWLTATDIISIRKRLPALEKVTEGMSGDEKAAIVARNKERSFAQARENLSAMLDAILEAHPDETLELIALCCFIEPDDADNHPVKEYLSAIAELLEDEDVLAFFISLRTLAQRNMAAASARQG